MNIVDKFEPSEVVRSTSGTGGYMTGFENSFATEALPGALPMGRNSPQKAPRGLYAEQLSGSAFTGQFATSFRTCIYSVLTT